MKLKYFLLLFFVLSCTNKTYESNFDEPETYPIDKYKFNLSINDNLIKSLDFYRSIASVEPSYKAKTNKINTEKKQLVKTKLIAINIDKEEVVEKPIIELKYEEPSSKNLDIKASIKSKKERVIYNNKYKFNKLLIEPNLFFSTFKSTDRADNAVSSIISRSNFGLNLEWIQNYKTKKVKEKIKQDEEIYKNETIKIDSDLSTSLYINYNKYIFIKSKDSVLVDNTKDILSFGAKVTYSLIEDLFLMLKAYYGQELYFDSFIFNEANIYGVNLGLKYNLIDLDPYILGLDLETGAFNGSKIKDEYATNLAKTYKLGLYLKHEDLLAELIYDKTIKNTDIYFNNENKIIFKLSYKWAF